MASLEPCSPSRSFAVLYKDKEFGRENRFAPYLNSQFIAPVLFLVIFGLLYYFKPSFITNFATLTPAEGETPFDAFTHKIPYIVFFIFSIVMVVLAFMKKLSLIPFLGVMSCTYLMTELGITNWIRFGIWLLVGISIYRMFGFANSKLNTDDRAPGIPLRILGFIANSIFFGYLFLPYVVWPILDGLFSTSFSEMNRVTVVIALGIAVGIELLLHNREQKKKLS